MFESIACISVVPTLLADIWLTFKELIVAALVVCAGFWWDATIRQRQINKDHIMRFHELMRSLTADAETYWSKTQPVDHRLKWTRNNGQVV